MDLWLVRHYGRVYIELRLRRQLKRSVSNEVQFDPEE